MTTAGDKRVLVVAKPASIICERPHMTITTEFHPSPESWQDANAVLLRHEDRAWLYRALTVEGEKVLAHIERTLGLDGLAKLGFVHTERMQQPFSGADSGWRTVIRHHRIARVVYPMEWTMTMWREALAAFCDLSLGLMEHGLCLVDAEPHNFLFDEDGRPVFIDFGSLRVRGKKYWMRPGWHREFKDNFLMPILLDSAGFRQLAQSLKREPFDTAFKRAYRGSLAGLPALWIDGLRLTTRMLNQPGLYFKAIKAVLGRRRTARPTTEWSDYQTQGGAWGEWKDLALDETLSAMPGLRSVLDVAGNKGRHLFKAARHGLTAILTDLDETSIDQARAEARQLGLRVFFGQLDLCQPTPPWGKGLLMAGSYERLRSDLVMALAVSHHLARHSRMPFRTFAAILDRYSQRCIMAEYVDVADIHVRKWVGKRGFPPAGYNEREFVAAFTALGYTVAKRWTDSAAARTIFLFEKP